MAGSAMAPRRSGATFAVTFCALPGVDGVRALRAMLKRALRSYGLRAIATYEVSPACPAKARAPGATPVQFHEETNHDDARRCVLRLRRKPGGIFQEGCQ
jgi:hypothetical protein